MKKDMRESVQGQAPPDLQGLSSQASAEQSSETNGPGSPKTARLGSRVLSLAVLLYFLVLCHYIRLPYTNEDGKYALAAREVAGQGLPVRLSGFRRFEPNPEFAFYVMVLCQRILGFSEFATKLPSVLMGLLALIGTFLFFPVTLRNELKW